MDEQREKLIRYTALGVTALLVLLSLSLGFLLQGQGRLEAGFALPRISPTPKPTFTPTPAQVQVTAAPTPVRVRVYQNYPPEAVDLVADGRVLFTLESPDAARQALEQYLQELASWGLGHDERLIRAGFDRTLTLEEPSGQGELLSPEEAVGTLKADESLLPVVRTVVRCVIERGTRDAITRENPRLLQGSRIYRSYGVYPYTLSYYETVYQGQAAYSERKTNEFSVGPGRADRVVEEGTLAVQEASAAAGPGALTVAGFQPAWPASGAVSGSFGRGDEGMCYGVEIAAESGGRVVAPAEGVVVYCGQRGKLGLVIDILHDETGCLSRIIGCQRATVELYQRVKRGEQVGVLPESSASRTVVFRYELLIDGIPVNPEKYLPKR